MDAENGEEHPSGSVRDRKESCKLILQRNGPSAARKKLGDCRCGTGVGVRQRETPEGRDRHNLDEKERRRDLAAREFKLANVLGLSRSCKKKELLRRARKEIESLKSEERKLEESKRKEQMHQERLKGQLNVLTRIQPEVPPQIWRNEFASAVSITANDVPQPNSVRSSRKRRQSDSIPAWQGMSYRNLVDVRSLIALEPSSSAELSIERQHENALQLPHVFEPHAVQVHKTHFPLVPGATPNLPPLMNVGIPVHSDYFAYSPTVFSPSMVPLLPHCSRGGSTDSESSSPSHTWSYSPGSSPHSEERHCADVLPLENTLSIKREPDDSFSWDC